MIVVRITGGLGNQMFQYALARALQAQGRDVRLHWHPHKTKSQHMGWALDSCFVEPLSGKVPLLNGSAAGRALAWLLRKARRIRQGDNIGYCPGLLEGENSYLDGYWQSERYFQEVHEQIRQDFRFRQPSGERNVGMLDFISGNRCIAVHVRRGDYVGHPELGGVCGPEYYQRALEQARQNLSGAVPLVFSDDVQAALEMLGEPAAIGVDWNSGEDAWMDMALMTHCDAHIIANSTFSWWGAWLSGGKGSVWCPSNWFAQGASVRNEEPCPASWAQV